MWTNRAKLAFFKNLTFFSAWQYACQHVINRFSTELLTLGNVMDQVKLVQGKADVILSDMEKLFSKDARLTLVARVPGNDDAVLIFTKDKLEDVEKVIKKYRSEN